MYIGEKRVILAPFKFTEIICSEIMDNEERFGVQNAVKFGGNLLMCKNEENVSGGFMS